MKRGKVRAERGARSPAKQRAQNGKRKKDPRSKAKSTTRERRRQAGSAERRRAAKRAHVQRKKTGVPAKAQRSGFCGERSRSRSVGETATKGSGKQYGRSLTGNCKFTRAWRNWISGPGLWREESMKRTPPGASRQGTSRTL